MISNTFYAGNIACETEKYGEGAARITSYGKGLAKLYKEAQSAKDNEIGVPQEKVANDNFEKLASVKPNTAENGGIC